MNAGGQSFSRLTAGTAPRDPQLLGELLHSLSQPLTSLRCSLELSINGAAEQQQQTVSAALQQTETVIGMIQLMREYLDAEQLAGVQAVALMPVLRSLVEDLASVAAVRNIRLRVAGSCAATLSISEARMRLALQYLLAAMIERQPADSEITLLMAEGPAGAVLRAHGERRFLGGEGRSRDAQVLGAQAVEGRGSERAPDNSAGRRDSLRATTRRVRLAIATRMLETAGVTVVLDDGAPGFVLRIPRAPAGTE